eukprot:6404545-Alexandrium_andersonii.AAC.1
MQNASLSAPKLLSAFRRFQADPESADQRCNALKKAFWIRGSRINLHTAVWGVSVRSGCFALPEG